MLILQYRRTGMAAICTDELVDHSILECSLAISQCHSQTHVPASNSATDATTDVIVLPTVKNRIGGN